MTAHFTNLNLASGAVVAAVANSLWQTAAVAAVAWLGMRLVPRMNAATRHLIWWAVLGVTVLLPLAALRPSPRIPRGPAAWAPAARQIVVRNLDGATVYRTMVPSEVRSAVAARRVRALEVRPGGWPTLILAIWAAVALLQFTRVLWSYCYLRELKFRARPLTTELRANFDIWMTACRIRRRTSLLVSDEIVSPMAVGFFHPAVILPSTLLEHFRDEELDQVLLHELAHIARRDDWTNLLARLAAAAFALHPVAAFVLRRIEREREIACDDWVVSMTGAARPYAACLARLFEICFVRRRLVLATGLGGRSSQLGHRIESLMKRTREFTPKPSMARVALCTPVLLVLATAGAFAPRWLAFAQVAPAPAVFSRPVRTVQTITYARRGPSGGQSFLAALVAAGYGNLSVDDIISLKSAGVNTQLLNGLGALGIDKLNPREIIALTQHGVSADYLGRMYASGIRDLKFQDIIDLASNGVRPEVIKEIHALGFGPYTAREAIQFTQHGVRPDLFLGLRDFGMAGVSPDEIVLMQQSGLNARSLKEAREYGPNLTVRQIIRLKNAGVI